MRQGFQISLGLAVLLIAAVAAWFVFSAAAQYLLGLDKTIAPAVIGGLVSVFSVLFVFWKERSRARAEAHREKKIEAYSNFVDIVFGMLKQLKKNKSLDDYADSDQVKDKFFDLMRGVTFYGSPSVIVALNNWKVNATNPTDPLDGIRRVGDVLLAIRKDIGLSNFGIDNLSIHQIYVNEDIRQMNRRGN